MSVLVAGSLHWDVIVSAPHLPRLDETLVGSAVRYAFGGKGGNQALAAARMGASTAMAGAVGQDAAADSLLGALDAGGVDRRQVRQGPGSSGMSVAILNPAGEYGAVIVSAANLGFDGAVDVPRGTSHVLIQNEIPPAANLAVARRARAAGAALIWNAAPARPADRELLGMAAILVVNRIEAADLLGLPRLDDPPAAARALAAQGCPAVIVTLGAAGLVLWDGALCEMAAPQVTVVNAHGAGDAFLGALAAALDRGDRLRAACAFAQGAAALHVATPPAGRAALSAATVRAFLGGIA